MPATRAYGRAGRDVVNKGIGRREVLFLCVCCALAR